MIVLNSQSKDREHEEPYSDIMMSLPPQHSKEDT
jgi:hypothetical protein